MQRPGKDKFDSAEELVSFAQDLNDEEVKLVGQILHRLQDKYGRRSNSVENLDQLRDEGLTKFAEIGILATFDPTPTFYGEAPNFEIVGKIAGHAEHKEGFDYEKQRFMVRRANERGEAYLGQKEAPNAGSAKRRNKAK